MWLTHAVRHLLQFPCGLAILIHLKSLSLNSAENAELYARVCHILCPRYLLCRRHCHFIWIKLAIVSRLISLGYLIMSALYFVLPFARFGWRFEEGHERWEANYYRGMLPFVVYIQDKYLCYLYVFLTIRPQKNLPTRLGCHVPFSHLCFISVHGCKHGWVQDTRHAQNISMSFFPKRI